MDYDTGLLAQRSPLGSTNIQSLTDGEHMLIISEAGW